MARAKFNAMLQELSGTLGNGVWVRSREGSVVRQRVTPANPDTPPQVAARGRLTEATRLFKTFTQAQEEAWSEFAETLGSRDAVTGKATVPTAINAFVKLATKWRMVNPTGAIPTTPPTEPYSGDNLTWTALASTGKITFTGSGPNSDDTTTEFLVQRLASRVRNPQKKAYRSKGFKQLTPGSLSFVVDTTPGWYAVAIRYVNTSTGQETDLVHLPLVQVTIALASGGTASKKKAA